MHVNHLSILTRDCWLSKLIKAYARSCK